MASRDGRGRAAPDALVTNQAVEASGMDDFRLLMVSSLAATPLVFLPEKAAGPVEGTVRPCWSERSG